MSQYTREEVEGILALRKRSNLPEGMGPTIPWLEFKFRITPEALEGLLGARIVRADGSEVILGGLYVDQDGLVEPILRSYVPGET